MRLQRYYQHVLILVLLPALICCTAQEPRPKNHGASDPKRDLNDYAELAVSIAEEIESLSQEHDCFRGFSIDEETLSHPIDRKSERMQTYSRKRTKTPARDRVLHETKRVWVSLSYVNGITGQKPNPAYEPGVKRSKTVPVFASDGVEFQAVLYTGRWPGAWAAAADYRIGALNISLQVDGPCGNRIEPEIKRILEKHDATEVYYETPPGQ